MEPQIVNPDPKYPPAHLIAPSPAGYILIAAEIDPPERPGPRLGRDRDKNDAKTALLQNVRRLADRLGQTASVTRVSVFNAIVVAPPRDYGKREDLPVLPARFDVVVQIETTTPETIAEVQATPLYDELVTALAAPARDLRVIAARCDRRIGDVDDSTKGLFLFNFFVGENQQVALRLWDYLAGWYQAETGLDNSVLMVPLPDRAQPVDYVAINHAKWNLSLPRFLARQLPKKSFRSYLMANLTANNVGSMPILYRLVQ